MGPGYYGDMLRTVSSNANLKLGHASFEAAVKQHPTTTWLLKYPGGRRPIRSARNKDPRVTE
jgi:hypothetical protein